MDEDLFIRNHFESLLDEAIEMQRLDRRYDPDTLADFRCTVLNQLPARYIRSRVNLSFYISGEEAAAMESQLAAAIEQAHQLIAKRGNG